MLVECFADLLSVLDEDRRKHSLAAGRKAAAVCSLVAPSLRSDLVTAATLHDIGYGHPETDFHPLDGAHFLARNGFSSVVCHLVLHHSASTFEAEERGLGPSDYTDFALARDDLGPAHAVIWWADLTTGPQGQDLIVEERLADIADRHGPESVVTRSAERIRSILIEAGQSPSGSVQVRW